MYNVHLTD